MPENSYLRSDRKISARAETRFSAFLDSIASYARSGSWFVTGKFRFFRRLPDIRSTYDQTFSIAFEFTNVPLITTKERLVIWEKARGLWKGRVPEPIREPKKINYSGIPELSDRQLSAMRRIGRSTAGDERRTFENRLDAKVLGWLRKTAEKRGLPYPSLVNEIFASEMPKAS